MPLRALTFFLFLALLLILAVPNVLASEGEIYWVDSTAGKIHRANLDGSNVEDLVTTGLDTPVRIALDLHRDRMYWADQGTQSIRRANLDGTNVENVVTGLSEPSGLAIDDFGGKLYWSDAGSMKLQRANLDGSEVEDLVTLTSAPWTVSFERREQKLYWTEGSEGRIRRANLDGSQLENLVDGLVTPDDLAVDFYGGHLYWTDSGAHKVQRANLDGSGVVDLVTGLTNPEGIELGFGPIHAGIYWSDFVAQSISMANLDGTTPSVILSQIPGPRDIALDLRPPEGTPPRVFLIKPDRTGDYPTIQTAIDDFGVITGDTLELATGTFSGDGNRDIVTYGKIVAVRSQTNNPKDVTIDCGGSPSSPHVAFAYSSHYQQGSPAFPFRLLEGVTIRNAHGGPAVAISGGRGATIRDCIFEDNWSGGVQVVYDDVILERCVFQRNHTEFNGGGMSVVGSVSMTDCMFLDNTAGGDGGGLALGEYHVAELTRCEFKNNQSGDRGGAVSFNVGVANVTDCTIYSNKASGGGGVFIHGAEVMLDNSLLVGNRAHSGGAILIDYPGEDGGRGTLTNCVVSGNRADGSGGGIYIDNHAIFTFSRSILWGNCAKGEGHEAVLDPYAELSIECCAVDTTGFVLDYSALYFYEFNIFADSLFTDPLFCSISESDNPCGQRIGVSSDMCTFNVLRVPSEFATIQAAIDAAGLGDTVLVAPGTYPGAGFQDLMIHKNIVVLSESGPENTIIDCQNSSRGVSFDSPVGALGRGCILEGFTITNGSAFEGGGIYAKSPASRPTIRNCVVINNTATGGDGGGVFSDSASVVIEDCEVSLNSGGGIHFANGDCQAEIRNNIISGNVDDLGGGITLDSSYPLITGCTITGNVAADGGAGIHLTSETPSSEPVDLLIVSCTIAHNLGNGLFCDTNANVDVYKSIIWGNCDWQMEVSFEGSIFLTCSNTDSTDTSGSGTITYFDQNIFSEPGFCEPKSCSQAPTTGGIYSLAETSLALPSRSPCGDLIGSQGLGCEGPGATFTDIAAGLTGVQYSSAAWGDYDNDDDLDILLTGSSVPKVYENTGTGFTDIGAELIGGRGSFGDYDNDGDLDILLNGLPGPIAEMYENTGSGFTGVAVGLIGVYESSVAWGDYDNDGDLDILLSGRDWEGDAITKVYENTGSGFTESPAGLTGVVDGSVAWGDYDNDGDLDILLTGGGRIFGGWAGIAKVYENTGNGFTDIAAGLTGVQYSSAAWGDYDNDGDLDILLTGWATAARTRIAKVYQNTGSGFTDIGAGLTGVYHSSVAWGDVNNDGDLDILLTGSASAGVYIAKVYENTWSGFTDIAAGLTGVYLSSLAWGDYDNDGDLDILLTGSDGASAISKVYRNEILTTNTVPSAPTNLSATWGDSTITFAWDPATDAETPSASLSYNLMVGSSSGSPDLLSPMANAANGYRRVVSVGGVNQNTNWTMDIPSAAELYWSVQAVDGAFAGSPFAREQLTRLDPVIQSITDIAPDQGGSVRISVLSSALDNVGESLYPISMFNIWRRVDSVPTARAIQLLSTPVEVEGEIHEEVRLALNNGIDVREWEHRFFFTPGTALAGIAPSFPPGTWEITGSFAAAQQSQYQVTSQTLADSTATDGIFWSVFVVSAHTTTPAIWYLSEPDSGYSVDNIAPGVPEGVAATYTLGGVDLTWNPAPEPDFQYFRVYRDTDSEFIPEAGNLVHETATTSWLDSVPNPGSVFYKITTLDHAGNESESASSGSVTAVGDQRFIPLAFALRAAVPNPFRAGTRIAFDLPEDSPVALELFDVTGRLVRNLIHESMPAGQHEVAWDGADDNGRKVSAGVYFYRLRAGAFESTRRMVVIR